MDILIAPSEAKNLLRVTLPRPKDQQPQHFLYDEANLSLYEIIKYKDEFRSWFIGNHLCSEGHYMLLTKIDPLFVFLSQIMKYAQNQFRPLGDICQDFEQFIEADKAQKSSSLAGTSGGQPGQEWSPPFDRIDYALAPGIKWDNICDTKQIDDELFVKFSETKTIDWLVKKHARLMKSLQSQLDAGASRATTISYALDLLDDYVPEQLSSKFRETIKSKSCMAGEVPASSATNGSKRTANSLTPNLAANPSAKKAFTPTASPKPKPPANGIARFFTKK